MSAAWNQSPEPPTTTGVFPDSTISSIAACASSLVLAHGALAVERPDPDQPRAGVLVRQDRQAAIDLHRVGGHALGREPLARSPRRRPSCPSAVGPKMPRTLTDGIGCERLPANRVRPRVDRAVVLLRMRGAPLAEPCDRARDALVERGLRLPAQQVVRLADVGDVVRHLADERRRERDLRLDAELGAISSAARTSVLPWP